MFLFRLVSSLAQRPRRASPSSWRKKGIVHCTKSEQSVGLEIVYDKRQYLNIR